MRPYLLCLPAFWSCAARLCRCQDFLEQVNDVNEESEHHKLDTVDPHILWATGDLRGVSSIGQQQQHYSRLLQRRQEMQQPPLSTQTVLAAQQLGVILAVTGLVAVLFAVIVLTEKAVSKAAAGIRKRRRRTHNVAMVAMAAAIKAAQLGTGEGGGTNIMLPTNVDEEDIAERHPAALVGTFKPFKN